MFMYATSEEGTQWVSKHVAIRIITNSPAKMHAIKTVFDTKHWWQCAEVNDGTVCAILTDSDNCLHRYLITSIRKHYPVANIRHCQPSQAFTFRRQSSSSNLLPQRLRLSRGTVLPLSTQVRGFKHGRSRQDFFRAKKIIRAPSFGGDVKPSVPCCRSAARKRSLNETWK
jgi:uncharacterized protein YwbE